MVTLTLTEEQAARLDDALRSAVEHDRNRLAAQKSLYDARENRPVWQRQAIENQYASARQSLRQSRALVRNLRDSLEAAL